MLPEIISSKINTYTMGLVFAIQHDDIDSAIRFLLLERAILPKQYKPNFPPIPSAKTLDDELGIGENLPLQQRKWDWVTEQGQVLDEHISRYIHDFLDKND